MDIRHDLQTPREGQPEPVPNDMVQAYILPTKEGYEVAMGLKDGSYHVRFTSPDDDCNKQRSKTTVADGRVHLTIRLSKEALEAMEHLRALLDGTADEDQRDMAELRQHFEALAAAASERNTLRRQNAGLQGALERVLDAAKSYRSDILGCSSENPNPHNESWMDGLSYAPKWPGRDTSIEIGEKALALTPAALDGEATVKENLTVRENAALRAAINKAISRLDYCAGLGTQADFDATFQVMSELRSALAPDAPDETAGALAAIGMFDAALRAAKGGEK